MLYQTRASNSGGNERWWPTCYSSYSIEHEVLFVRENKDSIETWQTGWTLVFVKIADIGSTLCCVKSSNLTSCRSLLESDTLLFPFTNRFTAPDPHGLHLCSSLLSVALGERQRVGIIPAGPILPLDGEGKLVETGMSSFGVVWLLWESGRASICTSNVWLGDLGVAGLEPTLDLWCWNSE